jgi:hypothetical protein
MHYQHTKMKDADYERYQPFLGWKPLEIIKKTFEATTQFAGISFNLQPPLKRQYESCFPSLNKPRLNEMFCTDTWFGTTPALGGLHMCPIV